MRPGLLQCHCGADLRESKQEIAPPELVGLSEILDARVTKRNTGCITARTCGMPADEMLVCDLENLCRLIVRIATILCLKARPSRTGRSNKEIIESLPEAARVLSGWPVNFHRFCADWHRHVVCSRMASNEFQRSFSWLFTRLYKNLRDSKCQTRFVVRAALAYGVRHWDLSAIHLRQPALRALVLPPRRYGSYRGKAIALEARYGSALAQARTPKGWPRDGDRRPH